MEVHLSVVIDPRAEWRRAFHACLLGIVGALLLIAVLGILGAVAAGDPIPSVPGGVVIGVILGAVVVALLATIVIAGPPRAFDRRFEIDEGRLSVDGPEGPREIPAERILDLEPDALVLDDGERLPIPASLVRPLRPMFRESLIARIRDSGREYRRDERPARLMIRVAVAYLLAFLAVVLFLVVGLGLRAGGVGHIVAVGLGLGVWLVLWRTVTARREDRRRALALERVTLDHDGIEVVDEAGESTRIPWSTVIHVPIPGWRDPLIVDTVDTIHALPRSFHPSLARDVRVAWDAFAPDEPDPETPGSAAASEA